MRIEEVDLPRRLFDGDEQPIHGIDLMTFVVWANRVSPFARLPQLRVNALADRLGQVTLARLRRQVLHA